MTATHRSTITLWITRLLTGFSQRLICYVAYVALTLTSTRAPGPQLRRQRRRYFSDISLIIGLTHQSGKANLPKRLRLP